jgi:glycosyltransferase involved in cell wall biosynthesis
MNVMGNDHKTGGVAFLHPFWFGFERRRYEEGAVPSHRLWGQIELERMGRSTVLCPQAPEALNLFGDLGWRVWQAFWVWRSRKDLSACVAVHEISALGSLILARLGLLRTPLIVINFGLTHARQVSGLKRLLWTWALGSASCVVSLTQAQIRRVERFFGVPAAKQRLFLMPVDIDFIDRQTAKFERRGTGLAAQIIDGGPFGLAVGTNDGKDFETLLEAWPLGERLVIVTDSYNARLIRSHRCFGQGVEVHESVPMPELCALYRAAKLVIIPLRDSSHGSGHTVLVENMALGNLLVVSASQNMTDYVNDRVNALSVPVGDVQALRRTIEEVVCEPERFDAIRFEAANHARCNFSIARFSELLSGLISEVEHKKAGVRLTSGSVEIGPVVMTDGR